MVCKASMRGFDSRPRLQTLCLCGFLRSSHSAFTPRGEVLETSPHSSDLSFWLNFRVFGNCANDLLTKCRTNSDWRSYRSARFLSSLFSAYERHVSHLRSNGPTALKMSYCRVCSRICESSWCYFGGLSLDPCVLGKLFLFRSPGGKDAPPRSVDRASISSNPVSGHLPVSRPPGRWPDQSMQGRLNEAARHRRGAQD